MKISPCGNITFPDRNTQTPNYFPGLQNTKWVVVHFLVNHLTTYKQGTWRLPVLSTLDFILSGNVGEGRLVHLKNETLYLYCWSLRQHLYIRYTWRTEIHYNKTMVELGWIHKKYCKAFTYPNLSLITINWWHTSYLRESNRCARRRK